MTKSFREMLEIVEVKPSFLKVLEGIDLDYGTYGAWITEKGEVIPVNQYGHDEVAGSYFTTRGSERAENKAIDNGWIRVVFGRMDRGQFDIEFRMSRLTNASVRSLLRILKSHPDKGSYVVDDMDSQEYRMASNLMDFMREFRAFVSEQNASKKEEIGEAVINEISRPKLQTVASDILTRAGYIKIGQGHYSNIYHKDGKDYVLKVFDADDIAYRTYLKMIAQYPNEHFPKIYGKPVKVSDRIWAVRLEKLTPFKPVTDYTTACIELYLRRRDQYRLNDLVDMGINLEPTREFSPEEKRKISKKPLDVGIYYNACEFMEEYPDIRKACDLIVDHVLNEIDIARVDVKPDNLMLRGKTLVIIDPVA